jgi:hypothetical protein
MDEIRQVDRRLLWKALLKPDRLFLTVVLQIALLYATYRYGGFDRWTLVGSMAILGSYGFAAWSEGVRKRWNHPRFRSLWNGCQDRLKRMDEALGKLRRDQIADLSEMPRTMRQVSQSLYLALRRADIIAHEVATTEGEFHAAPPSWHASPHDPQSKELYRIADKNIAEYRQQYATVLAGVQRTEAQSAVYMTTLDSLRMKILGYRLVGKSPEISNQDFLEALAEARAQLQSIDKALEELDLSHYPQQISAMPPSRAMTTPPPPPVSEESSRHLRN